MNEVTLKLDPREKTLLQSILILLRELMELAQDDQTEGLLWKIQSADEETGG